MIWLLILLTHLFSLIAYRFFNTVEMLVRLKRTSLLRQFVNYAAKKLKHWASISRLHSLSCLSFFYLLLNPQIHFFLRTHFTNFFCPKVAFTNATVQYKMPPLPVSLSTKICFATFITFFVSKCLFSLLLVITKTSANLSTAELTLVPWSLLLCFCCCHNALGV